MDVSKLYEKQAKLDEYIQRNSFERTGESIERQDLIDMTTVALFVELGELANTVRCFKHWSVKGPDDDDVVIDELADVLHFYLSLGLQKGYMFSLDELRDPDNKTLTESFLDIFTNTSFMVLNSHSIYSNLGSEIMNLGYKLGFTDEDIEKAYNVKNKLNFERQKNNY